MSTVKVTEDGEACFFGLADRGGWIARVQLNGEFSDTEMTAIINAMADALDNCCEEDR